MHLGRTVLACLAGLIAALTMLGVLQEYDAASTPGPPAQAYYGPDDSLGEFSRETSGGAYRVRYGFVDHYGETHRISCRISTDEHREAVEAFGYNPEEIQRNLNEGTQTIVADLLRHAGVESYVEFVVDDGGGIRYTISAPQNLLQEIDDRVQLVMKRVRAQQEQLQHEAYRRVGFLLDGNTLGPDYPALAAAASRYLSDCFEVLREAGNGEGSSKELSVFLAFIQEITYEVPPSRVGDRETTGVWVPADVVVRNRGDCDSKATTFAGLWRSIAGADLLIIAIPNHALVGVAVNHPGPDQSFTRIGNQYFVLCEVAGPGKFRPGKVGRPFRGAERYWRIRA